MKLEPFWLASAPRFTSGSTEPLEGQVDVAVIGGGFTGLSAARSLAKAGARVAVLEAGRVVGEASGRNGGHCNNGLAHDLGGLAMQIGIERASALYRVFDAGVDTVEALVREEAIDCDFTRTGKIKLAAKPGHFAKLQKSAELLKATVEPDLAVVAPGDVQSEIGSSGFHGGLVFPRSGHMHMGRFGVGLAEAAARAGAQIHEGAAVTSLQRIAGQAHRVVTTRGALEAKQVLLATGASRQGPFAWLRRRIVPVGSFIIATEPLSDNLAASIMPTRRTATTTMNIGNYFRLTPDNRLIFGGRARFALSSPASDAKSGGILKARMLELFPQLAQTRIDYCWGGLVDMTADRLPRAGEREGVFYATGYSGHGTQMSVHMGQIMARVMGGDAAANPLAGLDWPVVPGHFGPPWFLPFVGMYYKYQDWRH
ncbi:FAD-binding oxidoreductase [Bosea sp. (in: a-proteobacteria)]|uniref:NAD(P)/FAD-dependent oxidoreductase n=1 Tax=Bosea sp. (in: a-proteobacteria) TaxID=1871050 RepID=UPI002735E747|nr:FAD-binding oxidoreductase [Bosea sp. (in: a-proteobacteria)]MDP3257513.1 FAD-binding oxidoreductase [Bosea sp. (in: a-proteobacteria)]